MGGAAVDTDLLIVEGVKLRRRRKHNMMDHICLCGVHPHHQQHLLLYCTPPGSSFKRHSGGFRILSLPHPLPAVPGGQDRPQTRAGADKALCFSVSAPPCQHANPRGPNVDLLHPTDTSSSFSLLLLLPPSSITLKQAHFSEQRAGGRSMEIEFVLQMCLCGGAGGAAGALFL